MGVYWDYIKMMWNQGADQAEELKKKQKEKIKKIKGGKKNE